MTEVNILSHSPEVTISSKAGTPEAAWTVPPTFKATQTQATADMPVLEEMLPRATVMEEQRFLFIIL